MGAGLLLCWRSLDGVGWRRYADRASGAKPLSVAPHDPVVKEKVRLNAAPLFVPFNVTW